MRGTAARAISPGGSSHCPVSAIHLTIGSQYNPQIYLPLASVQAWLELWRGTTDAEHDLLRAAWRTTRDQLSAASPSQRWRRVVGPIGATIMALLDADWEPRQPTLWVTADGLQVAGFTGAAWEPTSNLAARQTRLEQQEAVTAPRKPGDGHGSL